MASATKTVSRPCRLLAASASRSATARPGRVILSPLRPSRERCCIAGWKSLPRRINELSHRWFRRVSNLELGLIGNCAISALIDNQARVVWACMPRFDADPVFNSLLGGDGVFEISLEGLASSEQAYIGNTAALRTVLRDQSGNTLEIVDFAPRFQSRGRTFRPQQLVRRVTPLS